MIERIYVDASALFATRDDSPLARVAVEALTQPNARYVFSAFVELEALPLAEFHRKTTELAMYRRFFARWHRTAVPVDRALLWARHIGSRDGIAGLDALHLAFAELDSCDVILTLDSDFDRSSIVKPRRLKAGRR